MYDLKDPEGTFTFTFWYLNDRMNVIVGAYLNVQGSLTYIKSRIGITDCG